MARFEQKEIKVINPGDTICVKAEGSSKTDKIKTAYCRGFRDGFAKAQEQITSYIREMGYAYVLPRDIWEESECERD